MADTRDAPKRRPIDAETSATERPAFGARMLEGRTSGSKAPGQNWIFRQQPWWVVVLIFVVFGFVAGGFLHIGPSPIGLVVCPKPRWEIRGTMDSERCFSRLFQAELDDEFGNRLRDIRHQLDEARAELERAHAGLRR